MTRQSPPGGTPNRPPVDHSTRLRDEPAGAASRSEQSAPRDMFEESMRDPEVRKAFQEEWARDEAALAAENPAAEAAQSPQVGAAPKFREQVYRLLVEGYGPGGGYYAPDLRLGAASSLLMCGWGKEQPAAGPSGIAPVASADPELAALLREALGHTEEMLAENWGDGEPQYPRAYGYLASAVRSALSRLAGQAATREDCNE